MAEQIEHRDLRSALEYVVMIAAEGQKRRPPLEVPKDLKPYFNVKRLPGKGLGKVRRIVEANPDFRELLARGAVPELVDEVGRLWLQRPPGWETEITQVLESGRQREATASFESRLRAAEKKRAAAERAAMRVEAELIQTGRDRDLHAERIDELLSDVAKLEEERDELRQDLIDARLEARHARDREEAAKARWAAAERDREHASDTARRAAELRDEALASRTEGLAAVAEIESALHVARSLSSQLESLLPGDGDADAGHERPATRTPLSLPGGLISTSADAAGYLVRSDAAVLVDGYNVTKLQWAQRALEMQREMLLDAVENLVRRFGTDVTVVFDGASVVGAHARRRRVIRVVYSPEGVIADDVIRDEVRRLPTSRPVVVVTNDKEILRDVRAGGANTIPSEAFLAVL